MRTGIGCLKTQIFPIDSTGKGAILPRLGCGYPGARSLPVTAQRVARWQSGYAAACKAADIGSIPFLASISQARVAELVDATDLKSVSRKRVRVRFPPRAPSPPEKSENIAPGRCGLTFSNLHAFVMKPVHSHQTKPSRKSPARVQHSFAQKTKDRSSITGYGLI